MDLDLDLLLINETIRIEMGLANGLKSSRTGFFFGYPLKDNSSMSVPVIVTNKHVIKGALSGYLRFNLADKKGGDILPGSFRNILIPDFELKWMLHPDKNVDLAVLSIGPLLCELEEKGIHLFHLDLRPCLVLSEKEFQDIMDIEDIIFIGYPDWSFDSYNNRPIVRRGITATSLKMNFQNNPVFLLTLPCMAGLVVHPCFFIPNLPMEQKAQLIWGLTSNLLASCPEFLNISLMAKSKPQMCLRLAASAVIPLFLIILELLLRHKNFLLLRICY